MRTILAAVAVALTGATALTAEAPARLANPGFEETEPGQAPTGWQLRPASRKLGYEAAASADRPHAGRRCLELRLATAPLTFGHFGLVTQTIPAEGLRGKRVRFRAAVRAEVPQILSGAGLYARVFRPEFRPGHSADMAGRPVQAK